jgi:hypothetical protein
VSFLRKSLVMTPLSSGLGFKCMVGFIIAIAIQISLNGKWLGGVQLGRWRGFGDVGWWGGGGVMACINNHI